jgi:hypothetical protein
MCKEKTGSRIIRRGRNSVGGRGVLKAVAGWLFLCLCARAPKPCKAFAACDCYSFRWRQISRQVSTRQCRHSYGFSGQTHQLSFRNKTLWRQGPRKLDSLAEHSGKLSRGWKSFHISPFLLIIFLALPSSFCRSGAEQMPTAFPSQMKQRRWLWRIASSGMIRRVALKRTDVSEEISVSIIRVTRIGELGKTLAVTSNRRTLRRNTKYLWYC